MNATVADRRSVVRLTECPQCFDRRRVLVESTGGLRGHCYNCGRVLDAPLATESMAPARVLEGRSARGDRRLIA
jgi:uncharacterized Zn finger protein